MLDAADHYDTYVARFIAPMTDLLIGSLDLVAGARVLDHGTGTGAVARRITARWPAVNVVALDPNEALLSRLVHDEVDRIDPRLGTVDDVLHAAEWDSFDVVTSQLAVSFIDDVHREL